MPSRIRRFWWYRPGLPSKPGRRLCQNIALLLQAPILFAKSTQFLFFGTAQTIMAMTRVYVRLSNPITDRLFGWVKLPGKFNNRKAAAREFNEFLPQFFRGGQTCSWSR